MEILDALVTNKYEPELALLHFKSKSLIILHEILALRIFDPVRRSGKKCS